MQSQLTTSHGTINCGLFFVGKIQMLQQIKRTNWRDSKINETRSIQTRPRRHGNFYKEMECRSIISFVGCWRQIS
jgi:hypothetical protein